MPSTNEPRTDVTIQEATFTDNNESANAINTSDFNITLRNLLFGECHQSKSPPLNDERAQSESEPPSATYSRLLLSQGRGFPLYNPKPPSWLPDTYRAEGVQIGDVGILRPNGQFDFLFNIRHAAGHPINQGRTPPGFLPPCWVNEVQEVVVSAQDAGSYIANGAINVTESSYNPGSGEYSLRAECATRDGAILVLPAPTFRAQDSVVSKFRDYAGQHALSWYEFALAHRHLYGPPRERGIPQKNGSIYLITGWEKTAAWGTASFKGCASRRHGGGFDLSFDEMKWREHGVASVKTGSGPSDGNTTELRGAQARNQCVFLKGFKMMLAESVWDGVHKGVGIGDETKSMTIDKPPPSKTTRSGGPTRMRPQGTLGSSRVSVTTHRPPVHSIPGQGTATTSGTAPQLTTGRSSSSAGSLEAVHPSNFINRYMLLKFPHARIAITHDDDWCSLHKNDSHCNIDTSEFEFIEQKRRVVEKNGLLFLEKKFSELRTKLAFLAASPPNEDRDSAIQTLLTDPFIDINETCNGETALFASVKEGDIFAVSTLLRHPRINLNWSDSVKGFTPLIWAARRGHTGVVERLLRHPNLDVNKQDLKGRSALTHAVLAVGDDTDEEKFGRRGINDIANTAISVLVLLFEHESLEVNLVDQWGRTALWYAREKEGLGAGSISERYWKTICEVLRGNGAVVL